MFRNLILILSVILICACNSNIKSTSGIRVIGKAKNPIEDGPITIYKITELGLIIIDSTTTDDQGYFELYIDVKKDEFFRINFYDLQYVNLILTGSEKEIIIEADANNAIGKSKVTGSSDTEKMTSIDNIARKKQSDIQLLNQESIQASSQGDFQTLNDIALQYYYLSDKHDKALKAAIWDAIPSLAGLYGMNYLDLEKDFTFADSLVMEYQKVLPNHLFTIDLINRVNGLRSLAVGVDAPEISLPNTTGEIQSLSDFKGKYVLIDFWAAWCRPCRMENPNLVKLYNQYKDKNFEILGVSLDRRKEDWVKAIKDDGLIWQHISDLKYFESEAAILYKVNAIPATYLIDPEGKIIAKGLRGDSLKEKLLELFSGS